MSVFSFSNLLTAYYQCRKNKRRTINAVKFEINFETKLLRLEKELQEKNYRPGCSICFVVTNPKVREIFAADFRDRVVHHLLVNYLNPVFEPKFIFHSYACRKEKGALKAIKHLQKNTREITGNFKHQAFYLKIDIVAFFMSLNKRILFEIIRKYIRNEDILWLAEKIIFHNPTGNYRKKGQLSLFRLIPENKSLFTVPASQGLPIGNLTSQFFANVYLNELDQFAKHKLKIRYYQRYVDDILILHQAPEQLKFLRKEINNFLIRNLKLELHPQKDVLRPIERGIDFLGYFTKSRAVFVRNKNVKKLKRLLWEWNRNFSGAKQETPLGSGYKPEPAGNGGKTRLPREKIERMLATVNSYYGLFCHADTFRLRKHLFEKHFGILKNYFEPANKSYGYFYLKNSKEPAPAICRDEALPRLYEWRRNPISGGHNERSCH